MDRLNLTNTATLRGSVSEKPGYSHSIKGKNYYSFPLSVPRLSGAEDKINVICQEDLLWDALVEDYPFIGISGELRSYNNRTGVGNKLQIFVYASELIFTEEEPLNYIHLSGTLCKVPKLRVTPLGREICDLLLAVNRPPGRSDYLPCISWGPAARDASTYEVGDNLAITGRLQSRDYIKIVDGEQITRTAFEVSVVEIEKI